MFHLWNYKLTCFSLWPWLPLWSVSTSQLPIVSTRFLAGTHSTYLVNHWILYPIGPIYDPLCPKYPILCPKHPILTLLISITFPVTCSLTNPIDTFVCYHFYNTFNVIPLPTSNSLAFTFMTHLSLSWFSSTLIMVDFRCHWWTQSTQTCLSHNAS